MSKATITLYEYIQSELIKKGLNEIVNDKGELVYFNKGYQFTNKILSFDKDIEEIMNELFYNNKLKEIEHDKHFKKTFLLRFVNRQINRQTIESFQFELLNTFLTNKDYMNRVYQDLEKYIQTVNENKQFNQQKNDGSTTTDNRSAMQDLAQNQVNIDVDDTTMEYATDNTIARNKQRNEQQSEGETLSDNKIYQLDKLFQSSNIMEQLFLEFDRKCFLQVW